MEAAIIKVEYKDHTKIVLTNKHGDTYTSESESLMDFFCNAGEYISTEQPKWIPVTERLPEKRGMFLCFGVNGTKIITSTCYYSVDCESFSYLHDFTVTHWMPLPEPPNH